jgi:hypothetical protein
MGPWHGVGWYQLMPTLTAKYISGLGPRLLNKSWSSGQTSVNRMKPVTCPMKLFMSVIMDVS